MGTDDADQAEARHILRYVLPDAVRAKRLENVTFIFRDDISCAWLRLNAPAVAGRDEEQLGELMAADDSQFGGWLTGAIQINGTDDPDDPYFIECPGIQFLADDDDSPYQTVLPFMYRVCAWLEVLARRTGVADVTVAEDFRAFVIVGDMFSTVDMKLRARAADLDVPIQRYLDEVAEAKACPPV